MCGASQGADHVDANGYRLRKLLRRHRGAALAASALLLMLVGGGVVSTWQSVRARTSEARARHAEAERADQFWRSYRDQARAFRPGGRPFESMEALKKGLAIIREREVPEEEYLLEFRDEAVASLALPGVRVARQWEGPPGRAGDTPSGHPDWHHADFDRRLEHYARGDPKGNISVRRVADDEQVMHLPGPGLPIWSSVFSPDGRFLAVRYGAPGHPDRRAPFHIWDGRPGARKAPAPDG